MKAYGHSRTDKFACRWGCCTLKSDKRKNCRHIVDRTNRKTARQAMQRETQVLEVDSD